MLSRFCWILLLALPVAANAGQPAAGCAAIEGLDDVADARLLVIGEYHGTREIPRFVADVACNWLHANDRLLVGIELHESLSPELEKLFVDGVGLDQAEKVLAPDPFWDERRDGRHGRANLDLLIELAELRRAFPGLRVIALHRDAEFSERASTRIADYLRKHPDYRGLLLVGNAHARLERMEGQASRPLAARLSDHIVDTVSLNIAATSGGEVILCRQGNCGTVALPQPTAPVDARFIRLDRDMTAWNGTYSVGRLSVTPPVR